MLGRGWHVCLKVDLDCLRCRRNLRLARKQAAAAVSILENKLSGALNHENKLSVAVYAFFVSNFEMKTGAGVKK